MITEEERRRHRRDIEVAYERVAVAYVKARAWVYDVYPTGVPVLAELTPNEQCRLLELSLAEENLAEIKASWRVESAPTLAPADGEGRGGLPAGAGW